MAHTYLLFDFGSDEEKAQQARHKLESWKQAFRLDKKLLYKLERAESEGVESAAAPKDEAETAAAPSKSAKSSSKSSASKSAKSAKSQARSKSSSKSAAPEESATPAADGKVSLLVRLYFSGHEKLTEQRWLDRIPSEEPFKEASPRLIRQGEPQFEELVQQFEALE